MSVELFATFVRLRELARQDQKNLMEFNAKVGEETGELSEAVLSFLKAPGCAHKNKTLEDVMEEATDVAIVASALMFSRGVTLQEYCEFLQKKMDKWQKIMNR